MRITYNPSGNSTAFTTALLTIIAGSLFLDEHAHKVFSHGIWLDKAREVEPTIIASSTSQNLNNLTSPGTYWTIVYNSNKSNVPIAASGELFVGSLGDSNLYLRYTSGTLVFIRSRNGSTWSEWNNLDDEVKQILTTANTDRPLILGAVGNELINNAGNLYKYANLLYANPATGSLTASILNSSTASIDSATLENLVVSGSSSLGTVASGIWNGTTIATNKGGTGLTSFTNLGIFYATSTSTIGQITAASSSNKGKVLAVNSSGNGYEWVVNIPGTVTNVTAGTGISLSGTTTVNPTISISAEYLTMVSLGVQAYNALNLATTDVNTVIDRWDEVVDFLEGISESTTLASILSRLVTLDTALTISGAKTFSSPISGDLLGNSTTSDRLKQTSLIGSATQPVYFTGGLPVVCTYQLNKTVPSNAVFTDTASATSNILLGSNSGTAITYAPYTAQQSKLSFDTSSTNPTRTDRLNLNGYLYASRVYSNGSQVVTLGKALTISGTKTFSNTIVGSVSGNAGSADKVNHTLTIGNRTFDGSANVVIDTFTDRTVSLLPVHSCISTSWPDLNDQSSTHSHTTDGVTTQYTTIPDAAWLLSGDTGLLKNYQSGSYLLQIVHSTDLDGAVYTGYFSYTTGSGTDEEILLHRSGNSGSVLLRLFAKIKYQTNGTYLMLAALVAEPDCTELTIKIKQLL